MNVHADPGDGLHIRPARPGDPTEVDRLYEICLRTGAAGDDATPFFSDHRLLGDVFLGAYLRLEPDLAWVLSGPAGPPVGYLVGTADTVAFEERLEREWWPAVRARVASAPFAEDSVDALVREMILTPRRAPAEVAAAYPAHLHIDLLPEGQGRGHGGRLVSTLLDRLRDRGVGGVHLGVDRANVRAIGFYHHLGFEEVASTPGELVLGLALTG